MFIKILRQNNVREVRKSETIETRRTLRKIYMKHITLLFSLIFDLMDKINANNCCNIHQY